MSKKKFFEFSQSGRLAQRVPQDLNELAAAINKLHDEMAERSLLPRLEEPGSDEPTQTITVRLPRSLHDKLKDQAHEKRTSMNRLCIAKLLAEVDVVLPAIETG